MAERVKIHFYRRFGFMVLLFIGLLIYSTFYALWTVERGDYKAFKDRMDSHRWLFDYTEDLLSARERVEWPKALNKGPFVFPGHRWHLYYDDQSFMYGARDGGNRVEKGRYRLILPHPYADEYPEDDRLRDFLLSLRRADGEDFTRQRMVIRTMETEQGLNRLIVLAREIESPSGESAVLVLTSDATDILLQRRGVKERFLFVALFIMILGLMLAFSLTKSVIVPVRKLHRYAREISDHPGTQPEPPRLSDRWEISEICLTLQGVIDEQARRTERFRQFSSDTVHELKTPLTALRSALELLEESEDEEEKEKLFALLHRRLEGMEELMDEIYRLGKAETDREERRTGDLGIILEDLKNDFSRFEPVFRINPDALTRELPLSSAQLRLVLENLLSNGVSFSPEPGTVTLAVAAERETVRIKVCDEGPGIGEEHLGRLTERFYSCRENREGHLGLGLSLAEAVLDSCGGSLAYGNRDDGGAWFTVCLPVTA